MSNNNTGTLTTEATIGGYKDIFGKSIAANMPGSFSINDASGRLVLWNEYHRDEIVGKSDHEMLFTNALEVFHPEDKANAFKSMQVILNSGDEVTTEGRVLLCGGPKFQWRMITGRRIMVDDNPFVIAIGMNITERKRSEEMTAFRLRLDFMADSHSVEELLRETLDEAERLTDSTLGFCNFISDDLNGLSLHVFSTKMQMGSQCTLGQKERVHYLPVNEEVMYADIVRSQSAVINNCDIPKIRTDMPTTNAEMRRRMFFPLKRGPNVTAIFCLGDKPYDYDKDDLRILNDLADFAWDVITRKRAKQSEQKIQEVLLQAQKMKLAGQLAGGMAHDFNTMLQVILGNVTMAIATQGIPKPLHNNLKDIFKAVEHSADLSRQLIAFSQQHSIMPIVLDLNKLIERMIPALKRRGGDNIALEWISAPHLSLIKVDPAQIELMLGNLCLNACDAITGIGTIVIQTGRVHVEKEACLAAHPCKKPGDYVTLVVTDNGCGIEKKDIPYIFEPFFTTKDSGKRAGMGLSSIYGIAKQNNAFIDCLSERGKGSAFTIYFPRQKGYEEIDEQLEQPPPVICCKETILLVESEPDILNICKLSLENNGYKVLDATTSAEAINIAFAYKGQIHLLLTDVVLPEINGCDLSKKLQSVYPQLKTLFMSGYMTAGITGDEFPEAHIIEKPFSVNKLLLALLNIFGGQ